MHIFLSAGEPSGDRHAARLIHELKKQRPDVQISGFGGPEMQQAGCRLLYRLTDLAVMFIWSVVPHLATFYRLVKRAQRFFKQEPPDAVILVDYPGFNWHIARKARAANIPVFYYLPPQMWAWGPWRVRKMQRYVDHILCGLPFEPEWYAEHGLQADYVGHPFFDELEEAAFDGDFCKQLTQSPAPILGVLPGSRNKEIDRNWPIMLQVLQQVKHQMPDVRLPVACYNDSQRDRCRQIAQSQRIDLPLAFHVGRTSEIIEAADCCLMVSGSVSLEMLARATPAAVLYHITRIATLAKRCFLNVDDISLPNLFAHKALMPEWVFTGKAGRRVDEMAETLCGWLGDESRRLAAVEDLKRCRETFVRPGAGRQTADAVLKRLPPPLPSDQKRAA